MIIAITGKKRSGKDTLAEFIHEELLNKHSIMSARMSLATPIKEAIESIFGIPADLQGPAKEQLLPQFGISPRQLWQDLGSNWAQFDLCKRYPEYARKTGRSLWAKIFLNKWKSISKIFLNKWKNIREKGVFVCIVSDLRFPHEVDTLKDHRRDTGEDYIVIRVIRDEVDTKDPHISETEMDLIVPDIVVENNEGLDELRESAIIIGTEILNKIERS